MTQSDSKDPEAASRTWNLLKDLASVLMIPAFAWIIKLESNNAERDLHIQNLRQDVVEMEAEIKETDEIRKTVQEQALKLAVLEGKLDTANGRLLEIQDLLRSH